MARPTVDMGIVVSVERVMPADLVERALRRALRAAGIPWIRPHDLRHTYATLAIQAGTVSRQLGHASISTTADIYAHAVPGSNRAAAEAMEAILKRQEPASEIQEIRSQSGNDPERRGDFMMVGTGGPAPKWNSGFSLPPADVGSITSGASGGPCR